MLMNKISTATAFTLKKYKSAAGARSGVKGDVISLAGGE